MTGVDDLQAFIARIVSEDFLPLPRPDDGESEWDDIETPAAARERIRSGRVAEILFRDYESRQEVFRWMRAEGKAPGIPQWFLWSEEPLWSPHDIAVLFWEKDVGAKEMHEQRFFARRLSREECERFLILAGPDRIRW